MDWEASSDSKIKDRIIRTQIIISHKNQIQFLTHDQNYSAITTKILKILHQNLDNKPNSINNHREYNQSK